MDATDNPNTIKRFARNLRILAFVQLVALCASLLPWLPFFCGIIPSNPADKPEWGGVWALCFILFLLTGLIFITAAYWSICKIVCVARRLIAVRIYVWGFFLYLSTLCLIPAFIEQSDSNEFLYGLLGIVFQFYCIIPLFFIARWSAKKAEDTAVQDATVQQEHIPFFISPKQQRIRLTCLIAPAIICAIPLCALVFLAICIQVNYRTPAPPLDISKETTYVTGPLTEEGYIDYLKAFEQWSYPPEFATDENGFRIFVRQFGDVGYDGEPEHREFYRLQKYEKLGLDPDIPPALTLPTAPYKILEDFYKAKGEDVPKDQTFDHPWTLEQYPMLADWVNEIDEPLNAIAEAIRKPVYAFPLLQNPESMESGRPQNLIDIILADVMLARTIARHFQARSTYRIAHGDIDGAIDDKLTLHRFGRLIAQKCTVIQYLVGIAVEGTAMVIPVGANPEYPLTEQQIRRLLDGFDALPPRASINEASEWERFMALSAVQDMPFMATDQKKKLPEGFEDFEGYTKYIRGAFDWNIMYRRMNEMYDALQEPPPREKYRAMRDAVENRLNPPWKRAMTFFTTLQKPGGIETMMSDTLIALLFPALEAFEGAVHRLECSENMQRLTLAILLYQSEHGKLPDDNWAAGVPAKYFSCRSNPSPTGETTYALVRYADTVADPRSHDTILLVELTEPVAIDKAVIIVDEVLERKRTGSLHSGGMNVAYRSGAVRFLTSTTGDAELLRSLGRAVDE
jgi:hypothetical protein